MTLSGSADRNHRISIVGGGISGLAAAFYLQRHATASQFDLFESQSQFGGTLQTTSLDGFLIEAGADSFLDAADQPWASAIVAELGAQAELIEPLPVNRRAKVFFRGVLHDVPAGFYLAASVRPFDIFRSRLLSWRGKLRLAGERLVPRRRNNGDESLEQFALRRVGREVFERLVQPLVAGIYSTEAARLSVHAALPRLVRWEQTFGSLTAGLRAEMGQRDATQPTQSGARYAQFRSFVHGMESMVGRIVEQLPARSLHRQTRAVELQRGTERLWRLTVLDRNSHASQWEYDAVILALPHQESARLLQSTEPRLTNVLSQIPSGDLVVVSLGVRANQLREPIDCFGIVVPGIERRNTTAISFSSAKFPGRAPEGCELLRVFLSGASRPGFRAHSDAEFAEMAIRDVREIVGLHGDPALCLVRRWLDGTPQYELGHLGRVSLIREYLGERPGLEIAGAALEGIGVPQCVHSGQSAAKRVLTALDTFTLNRGPR